MGHSEVPACGQWQWGCRGGAEAAGLDERSDPRVYGFQYGEGMYYALTQCPGPCPEGASFDDSLRAWKGDLWRRRGGLEYGGQTNSTEVGKGVAGRETSMSKVGPSTSMCLTANEQSGRGDADQCVGWRGVRGLGA